MFLPKPAYAITHARCLWGPRPAIHNDSANNVFPPSLLTPSSIQDAIVDAALPPSATHHKGTNKVFLPSLLTPSSMPDAIDYNNNTKFGLSGEMVS